MKQEILINPLPLFKIPSNNLSQFFLYTKTFQDKPNSRTNEKSVCKKFIQVLLFSEAMGQLINMNMCLH